MNFIAELLLNFYMVRGIEIRDKNNMGVSVF